MPWLLPLPAFGREDVNIWGKQPCGEERKGGRLHSEEVFYTRSVGHSSPWDGLHFVAGCTAGEHEGLFGPEISFLVLQAMLRPKQNKLAPGTLVGTQHWECVGASTRYRRGKERRENPFMGLKSGEAEVKLKCQREENNIGDWQVWEESKRCWEFRGWEEQEET